MLHWPNLPPAGEPNEPRPRLLDGLAVVWLAGGPGTVVRGQCRSHPWPPTRAVAFDHRLYCRGHFGG
jgi:hypothetical protein